MWQTIKNSLQTHTKHMCSSQSGHARIFTPHPTDACLRPRNGSAHLPGVKIRLPAKSACFLAQNSVLKSKLMVCIPSLITCIVTPEINYSQCSSLSLLRWELAVQQNVGSKQFSVNQLGQRGFYRMQKELPILSKKEPVS